jgi:hypothetical protein
MLLVAWIRHDVNFDAELVESAGDIGHRSEVEGVEVMAVGSRAKEARRESRQSL